MQFRIDYGIDLKELAGSSWQLHKITIRNDDIENSNYVADNVAVMASAQMTAKAVATTKWYKRKKCEWIATKWVQELWNDNLVLRAFSWWCTQTTRHCTVLIRKRSQRRAFLHPRLYNHLAMKRRPMYCVYSIHTLIALSISLDRRMFIQRYDAMR